MQNEDLMLMLVFISAVACTALAVVAVYSVAKSAEQARRSAELTRVVLGSNRWLPVGAEEQLPSGLLDDVKPTKEDIQRAYERDDKSPPAVY